MVITAGLPHDFLGQNRVAFFSIPMEGNLSRIFQKAWTLNIPGTPENPHRLTSKTPPGCYFRVES
jgi:hypothetical protein